MHGLPAPRRWTLLRPRRTPGCLRERLHVLLVSLVFLGAPAAHLVRPVLAEDSKPSEHAIKAAFLFNFTKFVEWPVKAFPDARSPIVIAVLGNDPFGQVLDTAVRGKAVKGRSIIVRRFADTNELGSAHILFVSSSYAASVSEVFKATKGSPVLTVSEIPGFIQQDGVIEFVVQDQKVKLHVNLDNAVAAGLKVSAELLKVAKVFRAAKQGVK